jgi:hypothetical protein
VVAEEYVGEIRSPGHEHWPNSADKPDPHAAQSPLVSQATHSEVRPKSELQHLDLQVRDEQYAVPLAVHEAPLGRICTHDSAMVDERVHWVL